MINYPDNLRASHAHAASRQKRAEKILGKAVVKRIIGFALFLLGANREEISKRTGIKLNTFFSFLTRMNSGIDGLRDQRTKPTVVDKSQAESSVSIVIFKENDKDKLYLMPSKQELVLPENNRIQRQVILLTLAESGLLTDKQVANLLNCTVNNSRVLRKKLGSGDVHELLDKRSGQKQDYRVTEEVKGELIIDWAANTLAGKPNSSTAISENLERTLNIKTAPRTVRLHLKKLGLSHSRGNALISMFAKLKKTQDVNI